MRLNGLNDGSIKTFLILALLAGNIFVAGRPHPKQAPSPRARIEMTRSE